VTLPASPFVDIAASNIDNFSVRRIVFSTAVLQQQLIECCCKEVTPVELLKVTGLRILNVGPHAETVLLDVTNPTQKGKIDVTAQPNAIEVEFGPALLRTDTVNSDTLSIIQSNGVVFEPTADIQVLPGNKIVRRVGHVFPMDSLILKLAGTGTG